MSILSKSLMLISLIAGQHVYAASIQDQVHQVCLNEDDSTFCFMEVVRDGRSELFTTEKHLPGLVLNEAVTAANAEFQIIEESDYENKRVLSATIRDLS